MLFEPQETINLSGLTKAQRISFNHGLLTWNEAYRLSPGPTIMVEVPDPEGEAKAYFEAQK